MTQRRHCEPIRYGTGCICETKADAQAVIRERLMAYGIVEDVGVWVDVPPREGGFSRPGVRWLPEAEAPKPKAKKKAAKKKSVKATGSSATP